MKAKLVEQTSEQIQQDLLCIMDGMEEEPFYNQIFSMISERMSDLKNKLSGEE